MSRLIARKYPYEIAYGHDHAFGFFIQVFDMRKLSEDDEGLLKSVDQLVNGLTAQGIVDIAADFGITVKLLDERIGFN